MSHDPMGQSMVRFNEALSVNRQEVSMQDDFTDMREETVRNEDLLAVDDSHQEQMTVENQSELDDKVAHGDLQMQ